MITSEMNPSPLLPPIKWAGGKRWLVPRLRLLWESHQGRRLVEPFCGGLAVALGLRPVRALLNDVNPHLINFYRQIQQGLTITLPMANDRDLYYAHRARLNALIDQGDINTPEAASLTFFLLKTAFNGLWRVSGVRSGGHHNVPMGRYKHISYRRTFDEYQEAFRDWTFTTGDFADLSLEADDFVYADPPYDCEFTQYAPGGFTWADQECLATWLAAHPGPVVASNQATARIVDLYQGLGFTVEFVLGPRRISRTGDRTPTVEMLATRF